MAGGFVHLHLHSEYSLLDGACRAAEIAKKAREMGHRAVALTDHGVMFGAVSFYKACVAEGVRPILGCEVYVARRSMYDRDRTANGKCSHLILLCRNEAGYQNLCFLLSKSFTDGFLDVPRVDVDLLRDHAEGLIALSGCRNGFLSQAILAGEYEQAEDYARMMEEIFGKGSFYLEVQDHGLRDDALLKRAIRTVSRKTGIPMAATNDVHYLEKSDAEKQAVLLCIKENRMLRDGRPEGFETDEFYYKSTEEMKELFRDCENAVENTEKIAEMCQYDFTFGKIKLPRYRPENGMAPAAFLRALAEEGLNRRVEAGQIVFDRDHTREVYRDRVSYELSVIEQMGYSEYYLIVWDFVSYAKKQGIPVGPGRGSGAGSLVAYLVGITDVDSIRFNLLFERFLNPERVSMPDFDVDFCYDRRDEVIQYVRQKYGPSHTAQIITFGTLAARAVLRDVGRVLGMTVAEVNEVTRMIPRELNVTLAKAMEERDVADAYQKDPRIRRLFDLAKGLEGMPRHASTHAAGVVITEEPVYRYLPVAKNGEVVVTQFEMDTVAELGLLKFDFLALRYLTILDHAQRQIREREPAFDLAKIKTDDAATYAAISRGRTDGVFQLESEGMRQMLTQLKPRRLGDIVAAIALYRPGPMDSIPKYIAARRDPASIRYRIPALAPILNETYGCVVYQEQVMQIFREIAGYTFGHADVVRRAISKKKQGVLDGERAAFLAGALGRGVLEEDAAALFEELVSFANYAFNKSHAAAYALISYRSAYLKTHYPKEYLGALLTSVATQTEKLSEYISACRKRGIPVLPPDVNRSHVGFHAEGTGLRFGLCALKNLGRQGMELLTAEREEAGPFVDFDNFISRMRRRNMNKRQMEALIRSGAVDSLGTRRSQMLLVYEAAMDRRKREDEGQYDLFSAGALTPPAEERIALPDVPELSRQMLLQMEKEMTGMYLTGHLLDSYKAHVEAIHPDRIADLVRSAAVPRDGDAPEEMDDGDGIVPGLDEEVGKVDEIVTESAGPGLALADDRTNRFGESKTAGMDADDSIHVASTDKERLEQLGELPEDVKEDRDRMSEMPENLPDFDDILHQEPQKRYTDRAFVRLAGIVGKTTVKGTKKNEKMAFVTLEDETGEMELIFFPKTFVQFGYLLVVGQAVEVKGRVSIRPEEPAKVMVESAAPLLANPQFEEGEQRRKEEVGKMGDYGNRGGIRIEESGKRDEQGRKDEKDGYRTSAGQDGQGESVGYGVPVGNGGPLKRAEQESRSSNVGNAVNPANVGGSGSPGNGIHSANVGGANQIGQAVQSPIHKIFLRLENMTAKSTRRALALLAIFDGPVPVILYDRSAGSYLKDRIPTVTPTPLFLSQLRKLLGDENVVVR